MVARAGGEGGEEGGAGLGEGVELVLGEEGFVGRLGELGGWDGLKVLFAATGDEGDQVRGAVTVAGGGREGLAFGGGVGARAGHRDGGGRKN